MSKIDQAIKELLLFFKNFFKTFFNVLLKPKEFLKEILNIEVDKQTERINSLTYLFLATFVFVFTINAKRLSLLIFKISKFEITSLGAYFNFLLIYVGNSFEACKLLFHFKYSEYYQYILNFEQPIFKFQLYSGGLSNIISSLFTISFEKLIVLTLPIVATFYIFSKLLSFFLKDKSLRKSFIEIVAYINATIFLYYFLVFIILIVYSKFVYNIFGRNDINAITISSAFFWIIIILFSVISLIRTFSAVRSAISDNKTHRKFNLLIIISVFGLIILYYNIAKRQKDFDSVFDPAKRKFVEISVLKNSSDSFLKYESKTNEIKYGMLKLDLIITNNSDEVLFFSPKECATIYIGDSITKITKQELIVITLNDTTFLNSGFSEYENKLIFKPGETQILNLQTKLDKETFLKLSNLYKKENDNFTNTEFSSKLNFYIPNEDLIDISGWKKFDVEGFNPDLKENFSISPEAVFQNNVGNNNPLMPQEQKTGGGSSKK